MSRPRCSILIPVYGRVDLTVQCLDALAELGESTSFEIIVIDNASRDETVRRIEARGIELIENTENLGFSRACNQGARIARGELLVLLNNDTIPLCGWLDALVAAVDADPEVAVVGSKLLYPDGTLQHGGVGISRFSRGPYLRYRGEPAGLPAANRAGAVRAVTGACMLIRADVFATLGGLDETYENGFEDVDLCLRASEAGHAVRYDPASALIHLEGQTAGREAQSPQNFVRFRSRWADPLLVDEDANAVRAGVRMCAEAIGMGQFHVGARRLSPDEQEPWEVVARVQERGVRAIGRSLDDLRDPGRWPRDELVLLWAESVCRHHGLHTEAGDFRSEVVRMRARERTRPTARTTEGPRILHVLPEDAEQRAHALALASALEAEPVRVLACDAREVTPAQLGEAGAVHFADFDDTPLHLLERAREGRVPALVSVVSPGLFCARRTLVDASGAHCARGPESLDTCRSCVYGDCGGRDEAEWAGRSFGAIAGERAENVAKLRLATFVRFTSGFLEKEAERHGFHAHRHAVIPQGAIPFALEPRASAGHVARAPQSGPRIAYIGCIADGMGVSTLLAAIERTLDAQRRRGHEPRSHFFFYGPCDRASQASIALARATARPEIHYAGAPEDPAAPYRDSDVVVAPNGGDDCPKAIRQALFAGVPVIATRTGGIPEMFADGTAGLLVPPDDVDALARVLERFESSPLRLPERDARPAVPTIQDEAHALAELLISLASPG